MNQINLDKLLQSPLATSGQQAGVKGGELKLLAGELYTARLQMLSGSSQLQLQTPQGPLVISLPAQLSRQLSQQFGPQLQIKLNPAANNQLSLTLQTMPAATSSINLSPAQLQPVISQWLNQQLPAMTSQAINTTASKQATTNNLTVPLQLDLKTGQLQLAGATAGSQVLLNLSPKEVAAFSKLLQPGQQQTVPSQQASQPAQNSGRAQPVLLNITFSQTKAPAQLQLSLPQVLQPASASAPVLPLSVAGQQQLLQALISQLAPIKHTVSADAGKISLGQLSISIPPQLASMLASLKSNNTAGNAANASTNPGSPAIPLLLQLQPPPAKNGQWQLLIQPAGYSQQLTVSPQQADRAVNLQAPPAKAEVAPGAAKNMQTSGSGSQQLMQLSPDVKAQAWRNLLPLLSQPIMQPNSMPNLPAPLQQLFSQIQQSLPEISKPLAPPAVAAQLAALLQFQPLQSQPNLQTTGGTLALAIQLLLGHLSQKQLTPANNTPANRLSQLVAQLDSGQAATALRQLASLSSPLQQSQLASVDAQSQLQQWLLQLPLQQQGQTIMPQLLIEQREAEGKNGGNGQKQWQLTMKFDLQQYGNLLAVAKLQEQDLQLQFYTDHNEALRLAQKFLPLLKDRIAAQGLTVSQADCQLGKIPDSLIPRHNSLLTVRV
ncbi:hook-length control protein FliK [Arsukibacterium tuosuense]|uniref:Hook-length control protein FliK n=1 Tax=Arsukibacterium tuosuense TaxID=1323745 RepID=A0A285IW75_9GAMM|nr:flagellar hook-length control protein FliK [Arsukibacterium tuosuense]SNY51927.1 hook-length control protein FliK [Arsukibacterium tuosuense]